MDSALDPSLADATSYRENGSAEKKYNEIKQRNHKLMEYVQNQEREHKAQIHNLKSKLDESKATIRKLEDENLGLKFQLNAVKEKESGYIKQITEMKLLLRKYYNKVHSVELSQEYEPTTKSSRHPLKLMSLKVTTNRPQNSSPLGSTQENDLESPKTAALPRRNCLGIHERKNSACGLNLGKKVESAGIPDKSRPPQIKVKSTFAKKPEGDSIDDELQLLSEPSMRGSDLSNGTDLRRQALLEETKSSSLLEDKIRTLNHLPSKNQTLLFEPSDTKRPQSLVLDSSGFAKTLEQFLEEGYRRKFNMLSQNIVALNIKPEISLKDLEEMRVSRTIGDLDDVNLARRSFLRYVSKTLQPTDPSSAKLRKKSVDKAMPLFQDFFVLGVDREDLTTHLKQNPDQQNRATLKPKILYSYPSPLNSANEPPRSSIPEFAFPFGVDAKKLKSSPSFSDLNSVLFASNDYELRCKCFVFPLLSTNNPDDQTLMGDVIEKSNPNHLLYIVCLNLQDYIDMSNEKTNQPKTLKDVKYWQTHKIMCFVTYYPFINLFFDILITFFRILKVEREIKLSEASSQDITRHGKFDANFTNHYLNTIVQKNLDALLAQHFTGFGKLYEVNICGSFLDTPVKFRLDEADRACTLEASWACVPVFSYISLKDLLWFFAAFMLEKKLVFLSRNIYLLTATLSVIRSLIKPFKYPFPLIFNLPEVLMVLCDAPGAALIGINQGEDYLINENLFEDYPSCIFICLDEEKVYMEKTNKPELARFDNFEKSLLTHYARLNSNLNYQILEPNKPKGKSKKNSLKITGNEELNEKCKKVLEVFSNTIEERIIKYIPASPIYVKNNELDYNKLVESMLAKIKGHDKPFLEQFLRTQIFTYYLEQHFQNFLDQTN